MPPFDECEVVLLLVFLLVGKHEWGETRVHLKEGKKERRKEGRKEKRKERKNERRKEGSKEVRKNDQHIHACIDDCTSVEGVEGGGWRVHGDV